MKARIRGLLRRIVFLCPRSYWAYRVCRRYAEYYTGSNGFDMELNGELRLLRAVMDSVRQPIVFDVGANVGDWTEAVISLNSEAQVHCFEPAADTFAILKQKAGADPNIRLNPFGLSSKPGTVKFYHHSQSSVFSSIYRAFPGREDDEVREESIGLETLDNYCVGKRVSRVDYLKIDCEGHDFEVLKGSAQMLASRRVGVTQFEYGPYNISSRVFMRDILEFVAGLNLRLYRLLPRRLMPIGRYTPLLDDFKPAHYVLIVPDVLAALNYPVSPEAREG